MAETQQYPDLNSHSTTNSTATEQGKSILHTAQASASQAMDSVKNSQTVQSIANGPVADKARTEAAATQNEFANLAASRQTPTTTAATGQELTHYHSFFYNLLSWENPRATSISYATTVITILAARYVPIAKYALKALYIVLGITAAAEIAGKLVLGQGVATKLKPRKYYTIPRETVESVLADAAELANFIVIEFQRIVFAENVYVTIGAFVSAFLTYWLIKIMPTWGLTLFFTTVVYFAPLVYINNKQFIDESLGNAQKIVSEQANQVRSLAAQHTGKALEASQSAFKDYSQKAQEAIGSTKKAAVEKGYVSQANADKVTPATAPAVKHDDFPSAPKVEPVAVPAAPAVDIPATTTHQDVKAAEPIAL